MDKTFYQAVSAVLLIALFNMNTSATEHWQATVFPSEQTAIQDEISGAKLVFVTRSTANDSQVYFHQRSWLPDESLLFFWSDRNGYNELYGCLEKSGELIRFQNEAEHSISQFTAGRFENALYGIRGKQVLEWRFLIDSPPDSKEQPSRVEVEERCIAMLPPDGSDSVLGINESSDGKGIVVGFHSTGPHTNRVVWIEKQSGEMQEILAVDYPISHIQSSWETPGLISFARTYSDTQSDWALNLAEGEFRARIYLADLSDREPWPIYPQERGELVTHECWWVHDQITFCSGQHKNGGAEESHVKVFDPRIDRTYIIGAGAWWEGCQPEQSSKVNYWHASGSPDGRWVAGDNWHGSIALFSGQTARTRIVTQNHRVYGKGAHPHVGWSPSSTKVIFNSNRFGNPDICIVYIPKAWLETNW